MKKQLYIFGVVILLLSIALSGCEEIGIISGTGEIKYIDFGFISATRSHISRNTLDSKYGCKIAMNIRFFVEF